MVAFPTQTGKVTIGHMTQLQPIPPVRAKSSGTNHCHAIVEQGLAEHQDEEDLIDMDLLKHGEDGDRVHRSDQTAEQKVLQQTDVQLTYNTEGRLHFDL